MKAVQIRMDDDLITAIDRAADQCHQSRSAFARRALRLAITQLETQTLEQKHREGYLQQPVISGEFSDFEDEQVWID